MNLCDSHYKRSLRRLCFYTCLSFCPRGGGGSASLHAGIPYPPGADPPGTRPPDQAPPVPDPPGTRPPVGPGTPQNSPPAQCMLGDMVNKRTVCILLKYNLVLSWCPTAIKTSITLPAKPWSHPLTKLLKNLRCNAWNRDSSNNNNFFLILRKLKQFSEVYSGLHCF